MAKPVKRKKVSKQTKAERAKARVKSVKDSFKYLRILVYGKAKKGKTTFGASGPRPVLIVDCNEKGTLSVRNFKDVDVFPVEEWSDIDLAYWYLQTGDHNYKTVVIDTVTSLAQLCMNFVLGDEVSRDPTRDPTMPAKRDWGKVAQLMGTQILQFRNLPMHVVFLAQERRGFSEEDEEASEIFPEVSPSVRKVLTPAVDTIGRLYTKEVMEKGKGDKKGRSVMERRLWIGDHEVYTTGDRSESGLPKVIRLSGDKTTSLTRIVEQIRSHKEA